jgi:hypothetical protein
MFGAELFRRPTARAPFGARDRRRVLGFGRYELI